jgi:hypothetical protein
MEWQAEVYENPRASPFTEELPYRLIPLFQMDLSRRTVPVP